MFVLMQHSIEILICTLGILTLMLIYQIMTKRYLDKIYLEVIKGSINTLQVDLMIRQGQINKIDELNSLFDKMKVKDSKNKTNLATITSKTK